MNCMRCGKHGRAIGIIVLPGRAKKRDIKMRCDNPACEYVYVNIDGNQARGRPMWRVPTRRR